MSQAGTKTIGDPALPTSTRATPARDGGSDRNPVVVLLVSRDTKAEEAEFLIEQLAAQGLHVRVIDTSLKVRRNRAGRPRDDVALATASNQPRTKLDAMRDAADSAADALQRHIEEGARAIMGIGGGVGSWVAMNAMQTAPFGFPKLIVSTLPFDPRDFIANSDIIVVPSVADIMGLNPTLRAVLRNAAAALGGMARGQGSVSAALAEKPVVGITALGVTSPAAAHLLKGLTARGYETTAFHANGYGGRAFERWTRQGAFRAVIDLTTHEMNTLLFGGTEASAPDRLTGAAEAGVPQIVVPGGLDVLGRGPLQLLESHERARPHYQQNVLFTHIRASVTEMRAAATIMAERLNRSNAPVRVVVPLQGFSAEGCPNGAVHDPDADHAFTDKLRAKLRQDIPIIEVDAWINAPEFADAVLHQFDLACA